MQDAFADVDPFAGHLVRGEKIVWQGQPQQGFMLTSRDGLLIPLSLLWCGMAVSGLINGLRAPGGETTLISAARIVFVALGLYFVFGRFIFDASVRARAYYALTDRRILIVKNWPTSKFQSLNLDRLPEANLSESSNGRGSITFGTNPSMSFRGDGSLTLPNDQAPCFLGIENVRMVFSMIQDQRQGSGQ